MSEEHNEINKQSPEYVMKILKEKLRAMILEAQAKEKPEEAPPPPKT